MELFRCMMIAQNMLVDKDLMNPLSIGRDDDALVAAALTTSIMHRLLMPGLESREGFFSKGTADINLAELIIAHNKPSLPANEATLRGIFDTLDKAGEYIRNTIEGPAAKSKLGADFRSPGQ